MTLKFPGGAESIHHVHHFCRKSFHPSTLTVVDVDGGYPPRLSTNIHQVIPSPRRCPSSSVPSPSQEPWASCHQSRHPLRFFFRLPSWPSPSLSSWPSS